MPVPSTANAPTPSSAPREQRSLFGEILDWMLAPLLLLWPMSVILTWLVAQGIANKPFDRELGEMVRILSKQVVVQNTRVPSEAVATFVLPAGASEILHTDEADTIYYQVLGLRGEYLSGDRALPVPADDDRGPPGEVRFRDDVVNDDNVRVAYLWVDIPGRAGVGGNGSAPLLQVAETLGKRSRLVSEIIKGVILPQFVILPLAVLLVWLALARGIAPLNELQRRIRGRDSSDLSPIDEREAPEEVSPLVRAINDLLARLDQSMQSQKHFLADAAHQLKTPLAGLRMQADLAQRETDADELKKSLKHIGRASIRATHTVNQLLALARAEATGRSLAKQRLDLVQILSEAIQDSVPRALEKHIDLGYDGPPPGEPGSMLEANPTLLKELVRNLLDNALNYTPDGGQVTVRLLTDRFSGVIVLLVEDSGPGVAAAERELVFQPFYRALGTNVDGSGLGLAIVQEIARQHGASVSVEDVLPGHIPPGTRVTVRFMGFAELAQE